MEQRDVPQILRKRDEFSFIRTKWASERIHTAFHGEETGVMRKTVRN